VLVIVGAQINAELTTLQCSVVDTMETALSQRDPKLVTSALRRCVLNAERSVQRMRLSDIVLSVTSFRHNPHSQSGETSNVQRTLQSPVNSTGNESDQYFYHYFN